MDKALRELVNDASSATLDKLRGIVSKNKRRFTKNGYNLGTAKQRFLRSCAVLALPSPPPLLQISPLSLTTLSP